MAEYDFIIIGGGSSGCVVATRLSEDPDVRVLLLEAGPSDQEYPQIYDPTKFNTLKKSAIDWSFKTEATDKAYQAYNADGIATWPRGKVLGGSSCLNHMMYVRGDSSDYDSWQKLGATGWGWKDVLPYFLKMENYQGSEFLDSPYHNVGGPYNVIDIPATLDATRCFIQAGVELGYEEVDTNGGTSLGFGILQKSIDSSGQRGSTASTYLHPVEDRSNLTVITNAHVLKILFEGLQAVSVRYLQNGEEKIVSTSKEIIVSAGSIGSPQLLLLSGIGPKSHLDDFGIDCIADLPVGKNLQDHLFVQLKATVDESAEVATADNLVSGYSVPALGYIHSGAKSVSTPPEGWPDMQLLFLPSLYPHGLDEQTEVYVLKSPSLHPLQGYDLSREERMRKKGIAIHLMLTHPMSLGFLKLRSTDPLSPPIIQPNYLKEQHDIEVFCESIRFVRKLCDTEAMSKMRPKLLNLTMSGNTHGEYSNENLEDFVRHFVHTCYHPVGTCKMGSSDDESAVVDQMLRVRGITGLRVIDASIMPHVTTGNTNVPCIMIGEKGADLIKQTYRK